MVEKRNRLRIIYDILNMIRNHNNSIKPTPLLRYSNLSSQSFSTYLVELMEKGFVAEGHDKKNRKILMLTGRGLIYLQKYKVITKFVEDFNL
jgi:predicted transcriptional regulator